MVASSLSLPALVSAFPFLGSLWAWLHMYLCFDWAFAQLIFILLTSLHCGRIYFSPADIRLDIPLGNRGGQKGQCTVSKLRLWEMWQVTSRTLAVLPSARTRACVCRLGPRMRDMWNIPERASQPEAVRPSDPWARKCCCCKPVRIWEVGVIFAGGITAAKSSFILPFCLYI